MREKYIVKIHLNSVPFGIWYDQKNKLIKVGGTTGARKDIEHLNHEYFKGLLEDKDWKGRVRKQLKILDDNMWHNVIKILGKDGMLIAVRSFRRMIG